MQRYNITFVSTNAFGELLKMNSRVLPDINQSSPVDCHLPLDRVGMEGIALPVLIEGQTVACLVDAYVDIAAPQVRGIHMSRLYLSLESLTRNELCHQTIQECLESFLASHEGLSSKSFLRLSGKLPVFRPAISSQNGGWRLYPFTIEASIEQGRFACSLETTITYSSTCPCSAALARQLIEEAFSARFPQGLVSASMVSEWLRTTDGVPATPHSQRSYAHVKVHPLPSTSLSLMRQLIDTVESSLGTPVQTAVKREDEQAFALANGQNLMFCEDAARRIVRAVSRIGLLDAAHIKVVHAESLHAHDAVAFATWKPEVAPGLHADT